MRKSCKQSKELGDQRVSGKRFREGGESDLRARIGVFCSQPAL